MQYSQRRWCITAVPLLSALVLLAHGATIKFDQSQTGDYNLQIHLKNIELYAVFDDSSGSDDEVSKPGQPNIIVNNILIEYRSFIIYSITPNLNIPVTRGGGRLYYTGTLMIFLDLSLVLISVFWYGSHTNHYNWRREEDLLNIWFPPPHLQSNP